MTLPEVNRPYRIILMGLTIQMGALNIGYVLSYLTLSIDTLFANLYLRSFKNSQIPAEEETQTLSLINGILPLGCFVGAIIGFLAKKKLSNRHSLILADLIGMTSLLTLVASTPVIVAFRFLLGLANGMQSFIMPVYFKSLCPQRYYVPLSMILGYGANTGITIGHLMGLGYLKSHGAESNWWRIVFILPGIICFIRTSAILLFFNLDSPDQLIKSGQEEKARQIVTKIYRPQYIDEMMVKYRGEANLVQKPFKSIFKRENLATLQVGLISMIIQIWCGSFAVFYYSAQIFELLAKGDLFLKTIYTICLGIFSSLAQVAVMWLVKWFGSKNLLMIGSIMMGVINFLIASLAEQTSSSIMFGIFILMVLLLMFYAVSLGPVGWSIVPHLNDSDTTFFIMDMRWGVQTILVFMFPYMVASINIQGCFILFGVVDILYSIYACYYILDSRGQTHDELLRLYKTRYTMLPSSQVVPQQEIELRSDQMVTDKQLP